MPCCGETDEKVCGTKGWSSVEQVAWIPSKKKKKKHPGKHSHILCLQESSLKEFLPDESFLGSWIMKSRQFTAGRFPCKVTCRPPRQDESHGLELGTAHASSFTFDYKVDQRARPGSWRSDWKTRRLHLSGGLAADWDAPRPSPSGGLLSVLRWVEIPLETQDFSQRPYVPSGLELPQEPPGGALENFAGERGC